MIQQDQPLVMDQDVLRAVIAVDEGVDVCARVPDKVQQKCPGCRLLFGGIQIIRLQPERGKERLVREDRLDGFAHQRAAAMDPAQDAPELGDEVARHPAAQKLLLPVLDRRRHRPHRDDVIGFILKHQGRDGARGQELRQPGQTERLAMNAAGIAEPIDLDPQFGQSLFDHPGFAGLTLDQHGAIGNAPGQILDRRFFAGAQIALVNQIGAKMRVILDVKALHQFFLRGTSAISGRIVSRFWLAMTIPSTRL